MTLNKCVGMGVLGLALDLATSVVMADVVAVVSSKSVITTLSMSQLTDIFLGRSTRFPNGTQAVALDQEEGSVARDEFYRKIAGKSAAQMKAYWSKIIFTGRGQPPNEVSSSAEMKKRIGENTAAIGYIELSMVDASVRVLPTQ
jgi:ABC-type phosphate transport system substrate-binding protein